VILIVHLLVVIKIMPDIYIYIYIYIWGGLVSSVGIATD